MLLNRWNLEELQKDLTMKTARLKVFVETDDEAGILWEVDELRMAVSYLEDALKKISFVTHEYIYRDEQERVSRIAEKVEDYDSTM